MPLNSFFAQPKILMCFACLLLLCSVSYPKGVFAKQGQQNMTDPHTETIVVTGTRTPKFLSNSPVSVNVISGVTMNVLSQSTVAQALNYLPGVVVIRSVKDGYNIQMQGFDGDNVLVLLNSQPLTAPTGTAVDLDQISVHDIEQIEVIRGAASVMYGSSAMGGVINIITTSPAENRLKLSYELGSYANNAISDDPLNHLFTINANHIVKGWNNKLNLTLKTSPGFDYDDNHHVVPAGALDKVFIEYATQGAISQYKANIGLQHFFEKKKKANGTVPGQSGVLYYASDVSRYQLDFGLGKDIFDHQIHDIADTSWHVNGRLSEHTETSGSSTSRETDIGLYELNGQYVWAIPQAGDQLGYEIVSGGVLHKDTLNQKNLKTGQTEVLITSRQSIEAFTQLNLQLSDLQLLAGIRGQHDSDFGYHSAIRLSGMANLSKHLKWRFGGGQGYRVPSLKERGYIFDHSSLGYIVLGNAELHPEESLSFNSTFTYKNEITSQWLNDFGFTGEVNLHYTEADNLIDLFADAQQSLEHGLDVSVYGNVEQAIIQGVDITTEFAFDQWVNQINYSYLDARDQSGVRLESRPYHQLKANFGYSNIDLGIESIVNFVYQQGEAFSVEQFANGTYEDQRLVVDYKAIWQVNEQLSLRFTIENIFDEHQKIDALSQGMFDARAITSRFVSLGASYQFY
nr:vitamin B12 transporter BtuB [uncultured bacterium]